MDADVAAAAPPRIRALSRSSLAGLAMPVCWAAVAGLVLLAMWAGLLGNPAAWARVWHRLPELLTGTPDLWPLQGGFAANVAMSVASMAIATVGGGLLGIGMVSPAAALRWPCVFVMNFLRNSPWLVLIFAMLYLLPFRVSLFGVSIEFPPVAKAIIGLSLPTAANFAEVIRGAVQSIHAGQWESARSLGYRTGQIYRHVLLPQALRRIMPGWMNLYAMLSISTALASVTGAQEVLTVLRTVLATENEAHLAYFYAAVFAMFFLYCYPIARLARRMERSAKGDTL
jgi:polar amino acid transport system permease protein